MNKLFTALKLNPAVGALSGVWSILTTSLSIPVWLLLLIAAAFIYTEIAYVGAKASVDKEKTAHQATITAFAQEAEEASARYRALEHQSQAELALMQAKVNEEHDRAEKLGQDVADAVRAGRTRVRQSICSAGTGGVVPGNPAAGPPVDGRADDGADHLGRVVRAAADHDAQIRYLEGYALLCQRTCPLAAVTHGR